MRQWEMQHPSRRLAPGWALLCSQISVEPYSPKGPEKSKNNNTISMYGETFNNPHTAQRQLLWSSIINMLHFNTEPLLLGSLHSELIAIGKSGDETNDDSRCLSGDRISQKNSKNLQQAWYSILAQPVFGRLRSLLSRFVYIKVKFFWLLLYIISQSKCNKHRTIKF